MRTLPKPPVTKTNVPTQLPLVPSGSAGSELSLEQDGGALVRRTILPGGVRVITERIPGMRSAALGAWVPVGSRDEVAGARGSSHYLEHLLFKGTRRRTARDIARAFDAAGGEANAATSKESTCYFARVLDKDLPMAIDVIGDMITSPALDLEEFERERGVILEELAMHSDDPTDLVFEQFSRSVFGQHPLGLPIGGTPRDIEDILAATVRDHYQSHYDSTALVIAAAGGVDHDQICELVTAALSQGGWEMNPRIAPRSRRNTNGAIEAQPGSTTTVRRSGEQANVIIGGRGIAANDPRRYALSVLHAVLGGGMSSRLFQEIREKHGLAYSVHSFSTGYADSGLFGLYAGCAPANTGRVTEMLHAEWQRLIEFGLEDEELSHAIGQVSGGLVLGLEDSGARMSRLGRAELVFGELSSIETVLQETAAVTAADVVELAAGLFKSPLSLTAVGPFEEDVASLPEN